MRARISATRDPAAGRTLRRRVLAAPGASSVAHIVRLFNRICPAGGFGASGDTITESCRSSSTRGCDCLCDVAADTARTYHIEVFAITNSPASVTLHSGSTATIPQPSVGPHTLGGTHPFIRMRGPGSTMEFGFFDPSGRPHWYDDWRILAHELCGHGRLRESYAGRTGDRPGHDSTIATENAIAAEHGGSARGTYFDPRQGESFFNPVGSRSRVAFQQIDGWHFEAP